MQVGGEHTFPSPASAVWALLTDPDTLSSCLPSCERLERRGGADAQAAESISPATVDSETYDVTLALGVASVKGRYQGQVRLSDKVLNQRYTLHFEGGGTPGFVRGEGTVELREEDARTVVLYRGEGHVGGTIAAVGQRVLAGVARMLIGQFFRCVELRLKESRLSKGLIDEAAVG
jgi:uncharacterized protein